ncbi:hypothetical protein GCM10008012_37670 [Rhizobium anhuiense]|nr:hypothetical protein GCM10008012_37670 [Rhizobium anhuiense]
MTASFSAIGEVPISAAIAGRLVAITVESICSMNRATARIMGVRRGTGNRDAARDCIVHTPSVVIRP